MHLLTNQSYTEIQLAWNRPLAGPWETRVRQLRGALAKAFGDDDHFHQRDDSGHAIYRYPGIQYRWQRGNGLIVGWGEMARRLPNLPWLDLELTLGADAVQVDNARIHCRSVEIAYSPRLHQYHLVSPILLFNQDNYPRYQRLETAQRPRELDRLLTAQLLTALRNLDAELPGHLYATLVDPRPTRCRFKQQDLLGITGRLLCNIVLPSGFAFGHAVSHGYGWITPHRDKP